MLKDLIAARLAGGQDLRFGVTAERVEDAETARPRVIAIDADGAPLVIEADFVVGADGSRSVVRAAVTGASTGGYFREYPFAWFGILCEAPPERPRADLQQLPQRLRAHQPAQRDRAADVLPVRPRDRPEGASARPSSGSAQARVPGTTLKEGPIFQRDVLRFRSFVAHELRHGRAALVGDAAHTVPPTGAKGMNLAVADVLILERALRALLLEGDDRLLTRTPRGRSTASGRPSTSPGG